MDPDRPQYRDYGFHVPCEVCGELVLGWVGQDTFLTPFAIPQEWSGTLASGAYHLRCLVSSGAGEIWYQVSRPYHAWRWPALVEEPGWRIHAGRTFELVGSDGWTVNLELSTVDSAVPDGQGVTLPVITTLDLARDLADLLPERLWEASWLDGYRVEPDGVGLKVHHVVRISSEQHAAALSLLPQARAAQRRLGGKKKRLRAARDPVGDGT